MGLAARMRFRHFAVIVTGDGMLEVMEQAASQPAAESCKVVLMCSGKGGCGRSSIARALLVNAAQNGISAIGIDFDPQQTLLKWSLKRQHTRATLPNFVEVRVEPARLQDWREVLDRVRSYALAVLDTPPTIEEHMPAVHGLCDAASMVLVPSSSTPDDLDSVIPWVTNLAGRQVRVASVLNRVDRRTKLFGAARTKLLRAGPLLPVEIPSYEDIPSHAQHGLTVLDIERARGADAYEAVWTYVAREIGL